MIETLQTLLREDQLSTGASVLASHARGESFDEAVLPEVVVFPESTADVQRVMTFAFENAVPVTPVAVNSSLEGHTVPLYGGISLDMMRMNRILEFRGGDLLAVVQPAVTYPQLNDYVRRSGLFFPIDPGAHASLGGMISTNASGTAAVRYGVTADYLLSLEVVTPEGEVIRTGSRAKKSSSGYNLTRLYAGAEGTLGVITEATVRLTGLPEAASAARTPFGSALAATGFVSSLIGSGVPVARCELIDPASIRAVNRHQGTAYPEEMTVFLEFHGSPAGVAAEVAVAKGLAMEHGATAFDSSADPAEQGKLWEARHNVFYALVAAHPGKRSVVTDVAVPISKLAEAVTAAIHACREAQFDAYLVGHAGDGNFHLAIFFDPDDAGAYGRLQSLSQVMVEHALSLGGTSTGEHGVGLRKLRYMAREHGAALEVMYRIKEALDPKGIMNPGKKLPGRSRPR